MPAADNKTYTKAELRTMITVGICEGVLLCLAFIALIYIVGNVLGVTWLPCQ